MAFICDDWQCFALFFSAVFYFVNNKVLYFYLVYFSIPNSFFKAFCKTCEKLIFLFLAKISK